MKQIAIAAFLLSVIACSYKAFADEEGKPLRYCYYDYDLSPSYRGSGAEVPPLGQRGIVIDIMDQVAAEIGLPLEWVRRPWPRCLAMMAEGEVDGLTGINYTPQRGKQMAFPLMQDGTLDIERTITPLAYYFFYNIYNPLQWDGEKFNRKRISIASPRGFVVTDILREKGFSHVQEMGADQGFKALLDRKVDVFVESMLHYAVARKTLPNLDIRTKRLDPPIYVSYIYNPVSKSYYSRNSKMVEQFWTLQAPRFAKWLKDNQNRENSGS